MDPFLTLTRAEFDHLKALQRKKRWDWPAVFSINNQRDIWPFVRRRWTPLQEREPVQGLSRVIDEVAVLASESVAQPAGTLRLVHYTD